MTAIEFYRITEDTLKELASEKGISDLSPYYKLTDYYPDTPVSKYTGISQIWVQMAFHAQNATIISNIVKFEANLDFLDETLCHFEPNKFLKKYNNPDSEKNILQIVEDLHYNDKTCKGLKWNSEKSKEANKDTIIRRYSNTLLDTAVYLSKFNNREEFLDDLLNHYEQKNYKELIKYFRKQVPHGFSVALSCDFLKEFDESFSDLPKPDIHIKDTLCAICSHDENYYNSEKREYECIQEMQQLTREINNSLSTDKQITVYQLDKMIWLICSGNFYLHNKDNPKRLYLNRLR